MRIALLTGLTVGVLVAGCGGSSSNGDDAACAAVAAARCTKLDECIKNGTTTRYGSPAQCEARIKTSCLTGLSATGTGATIASTSACAAAIGPSSCDDFENTAIPACLPQVGKLAAGAACAFAGQCVTSFCAIAKGTNCGVCAIPTVAGDSCASSSCTSGQACVADSSECQPEAALNGTCDKDHPCGYGLSCVIAKAATSGMCETSGATVGATCDPKRQTGASCNANQGFFCDATSMMCAATTYVTAGQPCGSISGATVGCTSGSTCWGASGMTPGMCLALAADGAACDTDAGPGCISPARCVTGDAVTTAGTCTLPDPAVCK